MQWMRSVDHANSRRCDVWEYTQWCEELHKIGLAWTDAKMHSKSTRQAVKDFIVWAEKIERLKKMAIEKLRRDDERSSHDL